MLTQEVVIYLGLLIRAEPALFRGLMTLRVGYLILLMTSELADELGVRPEEAHERLMHLSPSEIQARLRDVLGDYDDKAQRCTRRQESLPLQGGSRSKMPFRRRPGGRAARRLAALPAARRRAQPGSRRLLPARLEPAAPLPGPDHRGQAGDPQPAGQRA